MKKHTKTSLPKYIRELHEANSPPGMLFKNIQFDETMVHDDETMYYQTVYVKDENHRFGRYNTNPDTKICNVVTPSWCPHKKL